MAGDLELAARLFGDREMVAGLDEFGRQLRMRVYGALKSIARAYAADVVSSGLAEQGIKTRTGKLRSSMVVRGRIGAASASVLVYPGAKEAKRGYRYPWALGRGSPKSETMVREYLKGVPASARLPKARGKWGHTHVWGRRQGEALVRAGAVRVRGHHRKVNMKARPFMSGGAFTRLQSVFAGKMEAAILEAVQEARQATSGSFSGEGVA